MKAILVFFVTLWTFNAWAFSARTMVKGVSDLECNAYFNAPDGVTDLPLVVASNGTGLYSMGGIDGLHPGLRYLIERERSIAIVAIDKPGISYNPKSASRYDIDVTKFDKHTQADLVACTTNAIAWAHAQTQVKSNARIIFVGHSEGSQVAVRTMLLLQKKYPDYFASVRKAHLSGLPMVPWRIMLARQASPQLAKKVTDAIDAEDNNTLRATGGIPSAYWRDVFETEALSDTLSNGAKNLNQIGFDVYQGLKDANTNVDPILEFEEKNLKKFAEGKASLRWTARYYNSGHELNDSAINDFVVALRQDIK